LIKISNSIISIGTFYSSPDLDNFAYFLNLDASVSLSSINWQRSWQGYKGVSLTEIKGSQSVVFTINQLDLTDGDGRLNKSLSGVIGRLNFSTTTSTEAWAY